MSAQALLTPALEAADSWIGPSFPIRVLLLSECRILREAFGRALQNHREIVLVGAQEFSSTTPADIIQSVCDVLLMDPVNISSFDTRILDALQAVFFDFRIVIIDLRASMNDVLATVVALAHSPCGLAREANFIRR